MTDIVQRAKQALDWITPGARRADDLDVYALEPLAHGHRIHTIGAFRTPGDAQFDAAAPELVRDLLEEVTTKNEVLDTVLASAGRYHAERDALRAKLPGLLGSAWDDGNAAGLDGWIGPGRGAGEVDDEAVRARERFIRRTLDGDS